ncbi:MAG: helix-turn-helix domain-containing protein, partial [Clostridia bacterium]|nr:helix-turn-helix domain-containing protein [Clostridia bacterium]
MDVFKDRLIEAMTLRGMRASELAKRTGLSKARISQYVNGKFIPKSDAILLIAEVLQVSELWLLGKDAAMSPATTAAAPNPPRPQLPCPENVAPLRLCRYPILGEIACGLPILAEEDR